MQTAQNIPGHIRYGFAIIVSEQAQNVINELEAAGFTFYAAGSGRIGMTYPGKTAKALRRKAWQLMRRMEIPYFFGCTAQGLKNWYRPFNERFS
jgi:hypothetical protein